MLRPASRLLVVTRHSPLPENDGAGAYLFDLLSYLRRKQTRIDLLWLEPNSALYRTGWWWVPRHVHAVARLHLPGALAFHRLRVFPAVWWLPFKARALHRAKSVLRVLPFFRRRFQPRPSPASPAAHGTASGWSALPSTRERQLFLRCFAKVRPDSVLANYCWLAPLLDDVSGARKFVLTHDVASHRLPLTGAASASVPAELNPALPQGETALLARADAVLAISEPDAAVFRSMLPTKTILVTPKSAPLAPRESIEPIRGRCLFVGGRNRPNEEGLHWFLTEVWPRIARQRSDAHLHICGAVGAVVRDAPAGVVIRGRVDRLATEYAEAEVVVVPLLRGTGIKIKLVEAAAHGKACVTTPVGLQGLPFFEDAVRCAADAATFSTAVIELLDHAALRESLGEKLRAAAERNLSPESCYSPVARWLALPLDRSRCAPRTAASFA